MENKSYGVYLALYRTSTSCISVLNAIFSPSVCACHPWKVMGIGLIVAISQCVGILFWQITTDPVDLWAAPNSRSRMEKNYYDENFEPFYRTAQIFIRPQGFESVS